MIIDYDVIRDRSCWNLREKVRAAIKEGWQPLGGIAAIKEGWQPLGGIAATHAVAFGTDDTEYSQAMVQYDAPLHSYTAR